MSTKASGTAVAPPLPAAAEGEERGEKRSESGGSGRPAARAFSRLNASRVRWASDSLSVQCACVRPARRQMCRMSLLRTQTEEQDIVVPAKGASDAEASMAATIAAHAQAQSSAAPDTIFLLQFGKCPFILLLLAFSSRSSTFGRLRFLLFLHRRLRRSVRRTLLQRHSSHEANCEADTASERSGAGMVGALPSRRRRLLLRYILTAADVCGMAQRRTAALWAERVERAIPTAGLSAGEAGKEVRDLFLLAAFAPFATALCLASAWAALAAAAAASLMAARSSRCG